MLVTKMTDEEVRKYVAGLSNAEKVALAFGKVELLLKNLMGPKCEMGVVMELTADLKILIVKGTHRGYVLSVPSGKYQNQLLQGLPIFLEKKQLKNKEVISNVS